MSTSSRSVLVGFIFALLAILFSVLAYDASYAQAPAGRSGCFRAGVTDGGHSPRM
jgi:hypothetical protein